MLGSSRLVAFLPSRDLGVAKRFFTQTLGLPLLAIEPGALTYKVEGTALRVTHVKEFTPQPFTVLGWWVEDIHATVDALAAAGVELLRYPQFEQDERGLWTPPGSRSRVAWFEDPDGYVLSVTGFGPGEKGRPAPTPETEPSGPAN